ncbi:MAG: response regulator [Lachnospiraceae bacterium]|nr:response regulator [Lachnospiraceae bacterium]
MAENRIMVIGEKETFLIRILIKKIKDAGLDCEYVKGDVNSINARWEGTTLVTYYLEEGGKAEDAVFQFLKDKMLETGRQMILIGEMIDLKTVEGRFPESLIYRSFARPVNHEEYLAAVTEYYEKLEKGEFKKCILVVDDDPSFLGLVREWLKEHYKVAMANSGLQALKWLGKNKADLILLDYEMPVTSGPQVLEMLRSDEETKDIPVMFLTGKGDKESVMAVVALKPEGYFLKTIEKEKLLQKLSDYFRSALA